MLQGLSQRLEKARRIHEEKARETHQQVEAGSADAGQVTAAVDSGLLANPPNSVVEVVASSLYEPRIMMSTHCEPWLCRRELSRKRMTEQ